jgi:hypothetical protein
MLLPQPVVRVGLASKRFSCMELNGLVERIEMALLDNIRKVG